MGNLKKALSYDLRGMNGVIEKKDSKVKEICTNLLRNKWDIQWKDSDASNSEIEDGYDSDEDIFKNQSLLYPEWMTILQKINWLASPKVISKWKSPVCEMTKTETHIFKSPELQHLNKIPKNDYLNKSFQMK